jgi:formylglycine-generating enzyme required for sulfatase activity/uncharacterized caspase-like protein
MWGWAVRLLVAIFALVLLAWSPAHAEKRVALVIGNKDYKAGVGPLTNPLNDIRLVSDALRSVGFEVLKPVENGTREEILRRIYEFASVLKDAGPDAVGFLYYSGHGVASSGENYLIPVDITEPSTEQLRVQGVKQSEVLAILRDEAPNAAHYLVLDACRNNLQGARGGKGFVPVGQQNGVLVAFSTEPGKTALDTGDASGPYAAALAAELTKPGQNDLLMFHNIRVDVMDKTNGDQVPWTEDGIERRERPVFARAVTEPEPPKPVPKAPAVAGLSEAAQAWAAAQGTTSQAVLEDFIKRYGDGFYGTLARARLEELKKSQVAVVARPAAPERAEPMQDTQVAVAAPPVAPTAPAISSGPCGSAPVAVSLSSRAAQPLSAAEECALKPKDVFKECDKCPEMIVVPAGSFTMGSPTNEKGREEDEEPQHSVTISRAFAVGKFSVTVDQFAEFVNETGYDAGSKCNKLGEGIEERSGLSFRNPGFPQTGSHPAVCLNWDDAKAYATWLSKKTGKPYRLLSEAEWEYAARAGTTTRYFFGDNENAICRYGNGADQTYKNKIDRKNKEVKFLNCSDGYVYTAPAGSFLPNAFGLYDMHGNAEQWVEDCWHGNYQDAPADGSAWTTGRCSGHVTRGGSWYMISVAHRAAARASIVLDPRSNDTGFRIARTLSP